MSLPVKPSLLHQQGAGDIQKKTAILLSDTTDVCHWGCFGTSMALSGLIRQAYELVEKIPVQAVEDMPFSPASTSDFDDKDLFSKDFCESRSWL